MNVLENCLLLVGLPIGMILAGYWLAARLSQVSASERLAVAALAGLAVLLWNIAAVNFFKPLSHGWALLCLWPVAITLLSRHARILLLRDVAAVTFNRRGAAAIALTTTLLAVLLWPVLTRPSLIFYDGTSNHDAFFWISAAEHLKRNSYMELPATSSVRPLTNATPAIIGWKPAWGRMGGEGLLAFTSSVIGLAPLKLYLAATATLLVPWVAAVFLAVRTFWVRRLGFVATVSLVALQPMFVFFHENSNLPNFVGALMAAAAVIATERSLRPDPGRGVWLVLLAFAVHGLLCSYPEMLPFVVMPAGLLWWRVWFVRGFSEGWRPAAATIVAWVAGLAINPVSSARAWFGFVSSFDAARANQAWANLFDPLSWLEYVPALATLSVDTSESLHWIVSALLSLALLLGVALAVRRATYPVAALFTLVGSFALLAYTLYTGFNYGWQKTVQFGGAFWAAVFPVAIIDALVRTAPKNAALRLVGRAALAGILALFTYATVENCLNGHKWSHRKILTQDWFSLREYTREHLSSAPVLVDASAFRMAFFHGMWATYFLADCDIYFAARGQENGGYLRDTVATEGQANSPQPAAYLIGREWAETFDANSPRLMTGDTFVLLKTANRMTSWEGLEPVNGLPENAYSTIKLEIVPHSRSELSMELAPRFTGEGETKRWKVLREIDGEPSFAANVEGSPPWIIKIPLEAGRPNRVELIADPEPPDISLPPFTIHNIMVQTRGD